MFNNFYEAGLHEINLNGTLYSIGVFVSREGRVRLGVDEFILGGITQHPPNVSNLTMVDVGEMLLRLGADTSLEKILVENRPEIVNIIQNAHETYNIITQ